MKKPIEKKIPATGEMLQSCSRRVCSARGSALGKASFAATVLEAK